MALPIPVVEPVTMMDFPDSLMKATSAQFSGFHKPRET